MISGIDFGNAILLFAEIIGAGIIVIVASVILLLAAMFVGFEVTRWKDRR